MSKQITGVSKVSSAKGNTKKGGQAYQNFFEFKLQAWDKKSAKLKFTPMDRMC